MSAITSHVLDTALGRPASNVKARLELLSPSGEWRTLAERVTNEQGRIADFLAPGALTAGTYRLRFETGEYLLASQRPVFYPHIDVVFVVHEPAQHYHVPLLLSPFGYSTYRGS